MQRGRGHAPVRRLKRFHTGMFCLEPHPLPWKRRGGRGWVVDLVAPPKPLQRTFTSSRGRVSIPAREITILAPSYTVAVGATWGIRNASAVYDGSACFIDQDRPQLFPDPDPIMSELTL